VNVIVCTKAVGDVFGKVELDTGSNTVQCKHHLLSMNEADEYALEEALALKRERAATVEVLCVGGIRHQDILYMALAKGADAVTRIDADFNDDPQMTAWILAVAITSRSYDLILTGVESADTMAAQVGVSIAATLGLPYVSGVIDVDIRDGEKSIRVKKEVGGGSLETLEVDLPALLCVQTGIQPLSHAAPVKIIRARKQSIPSLSLADLSLSLDELNRRRLKIVSVFDPPKGEYAEIIEGNTPAEIANALLERIKDVYGGWTSDR